MRLFAILPVLISLLAGQLASAGAANVILEAGEELALMTRANGKNLVMELVHAEKGVVQSAVVPATSRKTLNNYLPSVISKTLENERLKAVAKGVAGPSAFVGKVMGQKLLRFPQESAAFFVALGAVMTYELVFNYAHNPMAYEQLKNSEMDPLGKVGFYFFMVGNGVAAEPLMHLVQEGKLSRKFAPFIPFFGMTVGFLASNIVHELGDAPNMWACARGILSGNGTQTKTCDAAATTWYDRGGAAGVADGYAPSLLSLVGSTIAAGLVQGGVSNFSKMLIAQSIRNGLIEVSVKVVGKVTVSQLIRIGSIEVATMFVPGGIVVKGLRIAAFVSQLALFSWLDEKMRRPIDFAYKNVTRAQSLSKLSQEVDATQGELWKKYYFYPDANSINKIKSYGKAMDEWRKINLADVLEAQSNWEMALAKLANSYKTAEIFYRDFLNHQWDKKFGRWADWYASGKEIRVTDRLFPLYGITPRDLNAPWNEISLTAYDTIEQGQMLTVKSVVTSLQKGKIVVITLPKGKPVYSEKNLLPMAADEKTKFESFLKNLSNENPLQVGKALVWANQEISQNGNARAMALCGKDCEVGTNLQKNLIAIRKSLGNPMPILTPGLGFAHFYQVSPSTSEQIYKTQYPRTYGGLTDSYRVQTPTLAESMYAAMLIGPDIDQNQSTIETRTGFASVFNAPKIAKDTNLDFLIPKAALEGRGAGASSLDVFTSDIGSKGGGGKLYDSAFAYLSKDGIRSNVLDQKDTKAFENWWSNNVENQYAHAWIGFETQYQSNVAHMVTKLWQTEQSAWNNSKMPNGVLASLDLENHKYLTILKNMTTALLTPVPEKIQFPEKKSILQSSSIPVSLMAGRNVMGGVSPTAIAAFQMPTRSPLVTQKPIKDLQKFLTWHGDVWRAYGALKETLKKIKVPKETSKQYSKELIRGVLTLKWEESFTTSTLTNEEIKAAADKVDASLEQAMASFAKFKLNPAQLELVKTCLDGVKKNSDEIRNYALIANAVSFRSRKDKNGWISPRCENMMKNQKTLSAGFIQKVAECE